MCAKNEIRRKKPILTRLEVVDSERCVGCQLCMFACNRRFGSGGLAKSAIRARSTGGIERGFTVIVCRACRDPPCLRVCPVDALRLRNGGGVILDTTKCIGCGRCADACPISAIFWDEETNKPDICVHCGYCAQYCPHEVLSMKEVSA